ncbi:sensor histidine kinase [Agriterribacter sp.]|uniref:tetratricopeptide repeat-containing sensor histidine kinase n=1 Tax=Agriterribacter sp. TaxID=2821509 RepID=UPI002C98F630|nr:sensor histidine kinase [Agriterribacter sp.]HRO44277.1 sensor histidine kinase [Agriterribacter sp.]HRQ18271.1 sensor histidine kinase [Agriterribacter sp.]
MRDRWLYSFIFFIFLVNGSLLFAQNDKTKDSLLAIALKDKPDSNSVIAIKTLQRIFFNAGLYDSAFNYAHLAIAVTKNINDRDGLAKAYYNLGSIYTNLYHYDSAVYYTRLAEKEALERKDSFLLVHCYSNFSIQYRYQNDYETSLDYAIKGAKIAERSSDSAIIKIIPKLYWDIGAGLKAQKQFLKTIEYDKKALKITNYPDEQRYRVLLLLEIGDAYLKLNQLTEAGAHISMAVAENELLNNIVIAIQTFNTQGIYFQKLGKSKLALEAFLKAYHLCDSAKDDNLKSDVANNIALNYLNQKQYSNAQHFAEEANVLSIRQKQFRRAANSFDALKAIAAAQENYQQALQYANQFKNYSDSTINEETHKQMVSLEKKYETEKKEKEIADLTLANTAKELQVVKRNRLLVGGGLAALSLMIILALLVRNSKQKQLLARKETTLHQEQIEFLKKQQQVVSLQSMVNGQETERSRIAKDLHDGLGGLFSTIKMYLSTLQYEQETLQQNALFAKSYHLIDTASEEVRRIAHNMMPEGLMKLGLLHALEDMCSNISAAKQLQVKLQSYGMEQRMNASTEIMLYRIVQELLTNIIKHAQATQAIVQFNREEDRLTVTVEDNGRGFNLKESDDKKHKGLETIKSRVNYLNGQISIDSETEVGTTVLMEFLINEDPEIF